MRACVSVCERACAPTLSGDAQVERVPVLELVSEDVQLLLGDGAPGRVVRELLVEEDIVPRGVVQGGGGDAGQTGLAAAQEAGRLGAGSAGRAALQKVSDRVVRLNNEKSKRETGRNVSLLFTLQIHPPDLPPAPTRPVQSVH